MTDFKVGDVVQFGKNHKWCGCIGIVDEIKKYTCGTIRYLINVRIPDNENHYNSAYIYVKNNENIDIHYIGENMED